jgi:hypothetical protein
LITRHYTYNYNGLLLTEQSTAGQDTVYRYYSDGLLQEYLDKPVLEVTRYTYDAEGNVSSKGSSDLIGWVAENDYYQYDELGRLVQVLRRTPQDSGLPEENKALLSIHYEYDAVGNIRDTLVSARYDNGQPVVNRRDYFLYDENNRIVVNKGQLVNGQTGQDRLNHG